MRRILLILAASLALQWSGINAPAYAEPKAASASDAATIRAAAVLVRQKKPDAALAKLDPLADRLAGNPDYDYVYGVAALEAGHPAQAAVALRRAIAA